MKDRITKKGIYIAAVAVVIAILAAVTAAVSGGGAGFSTVISEPLFKPLKSVLTSMVDSLEGVYGYMYRYDQMSEENEKLRSRISALEDEYREYTEISEENRRLRSLLGFNARHSSANYDYEPVSVISWTASNFSSSFTVSKGLSSGIELGDCVITEEGYLVGQITEVSSGSATVVTVLDTTMSIGASLYGTGETGIVEGDFELFRDGCVRLGYLDDDVNIIIGDTVITSGKGGTCPAGLTIGTVTGLGANPSGLDPHAVVEPAADLGNLAHLFVIKDFTAGE